MISRQHVAQMSNEKVARPTSIILCGGRERRFGRSKADACVGGRTVIERILKVLQPISGQIIAVTAPHKPELDITGDSDIITDRFPGTGPLGGVYTGLLCADSNLAIVVACDMPFLNSALLAYMLEVAGEFDAVVPRIGKDMLEPLHAVYAKSCLAEMEARLARGQLSITAFLKRMRVRYVEKEEYLEFDPRMLSFFNINYPEDFERANRIASGLEASAGRSG
jgi:molybdopterin-guanine dinucleotide biosynthesis protein A